MDDRVSQHEPNDPLLVDHRVWGFQNRRMGRRYHLRLTRRTLCGVRARFARAHDACERCHHMGMLDGSAKQEGNPIAGAEGRGSAALLGTARVEMTSEL